MKRILSVFLSLLFTAFLLTSCSDNNTASSPVSSQSPIISPSPTKPPVNTPSPTAAPLTPAEKFVSTATREQVESIMEKTASLTALNLTFSSVKDMSSRALFHFYIMAKGDPGIENYYKKEDQTYYVPLKDVIAILDQYFEGYVFDPNKVFSSPSYNKELDAITFKAYGLGSSYERKTESVKAIDKDLVAIDSAFYESIRNSNVTNPVFRMRLTIKVTDTGYRYISFVKI